MVQHVLSTLPRRNKWNVSSHRRFSPHSYWQVHNLACLWSEYKKSALTECPHKYPSLKTSDVPKIIDIKALPSYNYNERELCFCKAMVGREKKNIQVQSSVCFVCYKECTSISHKKFLGICYYKLSFLWSCNKAPQLNVGKSWKGLFFVFFFVEEK